MQNYDVCLFQGAAKVIRILIDLFCGILILNAIISFLPTLNEKGWALQIKKLCEIFLGPIRRFTPPDIALDISPMILIVLLQLFKLLWPFFFRYVIYLYCIIILINALWTFFPHIERNKFGIKLQQASDLTLNPIRRFLPPELSIDISPLIVIVILQFIVVIW